MRKIGAGRQILTGVAGLTVISGFLADWNRTHLFNPRWPPHAKFHSAWTVLLGAFLGGGALYFLRHPRLEPEHGLKLGALLPALFWGAQAGSFTFPNTGGLEREFPELVPTLAGVRLNEGVSSTLMLGLTAVGYLLERHLERKP